MKSSVDPTQNQFCEADYDFTDVPPSELESCLFYEYMRESKAIIQQVKELGLQLPNEVASGLKFSVTKITNYPGGLFEAGMFLYLAHNGKFPEMPWQELSNADKKWLLDFPAKARRNDQAYWKKVFPPLMIATPDKNSSLAETTLKAWVANENKGWREVPRAVAEKSLANAPVDCSNLVPPTRNFCYMVFSAQT